MSVEFEAADDVLLGGDASGWSVCFVVAVGVFVCEGWSGCGSDRSGVGDERNDNRLVFLSCLFNLLYRGCCEEL